MCNREWQDMVVRDTCGHFVQQCMQSCSEAMYRVVFRFSPSDRFCFFVNDATWHSICAGVQPGCSAASSRIGPVSLNVWMGRTKRYSQHAITGISGSCRSGSCVCDAHEWSASSLQHTEVWNMTLLVMHDHSSCQCWAVCAAAVRGGSFCMYDCWGYVHFIVE